MQKSGIHLQMFKESLLNEGASPEIISKNLAEIKANKVSEKFHDKIVLGADSVIDLNNQIISRKSWCYDANKISIDRRKSS